MNTKFDRFKSPHMCIVCIYMKVTIFIELPHPSHHPNLEGKTKLHSLPQLEKLTLECFRDHIVVSSLGVLPPLEVHSWRSFLRKECFWGNVEGLLHIGFLKHKSRLPYYLSTSRPTSQPMNNFPNIVAIFIKIVDFQSSDDV